MQNQSCEHCGGCAFRNLEEEVYRSKKKEDFLRTINSIKNATPIIDECIFIADGKRRRADLSFFYSKKKLQLGFNEAESHKLVNIENCPMLNESLNAFLPKVRYFLQEFCSIFITIRNKKNIEKKAITKGSVRILHADNGIDMLLEIETEPNIEHRMLVADFVNRQPEICRVSWRIKEKGAETIAEKMAPELHIADYIIKIPQDVFLQASKDAENKMIEKVLDYMGNTHGKIADLFCGLGTFTYPLACTPENKIISIDSYESSIQGLQKALAYNQIHNVSVMKRNLFKDPLDENELKDVKAIVIDPPRAGAHEQCREILKIEKKNYPEKIVFVSCNPKTFVYDANILIDAGYTLERITMIDQFVYSKHQELIALFINKK